MDAQYLQEGGPEWAYCATLAQKSKTKAVDLTALIIKAWDRLQPNNPEHDLIELLSDSEARSGTPPYLRYKFDKFRQQYLGQDSDDLRVYFQAYRDAPYLEITGDGSFRRLLMTIQELGLPIQEGIQLADDNLKFYPPVLRFVYGPQDFNPNTAQPVELPPPVEQHVRPDDAIKNPVTPVPA